MLYVFLFVSLAGSVLTAYLKSWFFSWNVLWQLPLAFAGFFIGLLLLFGLVLFVSTRFIDPKKQLEKPSNYFRFLLDQFIRLVFPLAGVQVHMTGLEKVPCDGRFLLISNHIFDYDPLIFYYALPHSELAFISKKENFSMFMVAQFMRALLCLPIDRENDREALRTILKAIEFIKQDKVSIAVFPEGYTSKSGELLEFRNGVFKIAQKANVPIVVCAIANTPSILKNMFRRHTDVYLDVLDVIPAEELSDVTATEVGNRAHAIMAAGIAARREAMA